MIHRNTMQNMKGGGSGGGLDDEEDDGSDADGVAEWNLRKCAAAALDNLSMTFGHNRVLPALLPALEVWTWGPAQPTNQPKNVNVLSARMYARVGTKQTAQLTKVDLCALWRGGGKACKISHTMKLFAPCS